MSVLVYTEVNKGKIKKSSLECVNYGAQIARSIGTSITALVANADDNSIEELGKAGATKILSVKNDQINSDSMLISAMVEHATKSENSTVIIFAFDVTGKAVAPRLSGKLKAGLVAGAVDYPVVNGNAMEVRKNVFSGKATAVYSINSDVKIISLLPNSFQVNLTDNTATVVDFNPDLSAVKLLLKKPKVLLQEILFLYQKQSWLYPLEEA
jgi:electron transfer flavoprotein alpha subunit